MGNSSPHYEIEGKLYDRITRILDYFGDPGLVEWKLKVGNEEARRIGRVATKAGSRVDELIKNAINKDKYSFKKSDGIEVINCMEAWELFKVQHPEVKIVKTDGLVRSELLLCAGTFDLTSEDTLIDVKCSGRISWKYWVQVAMYNYMLPQPKKYLAILRLHKSLADYEYPCIPYHTSLVRIFIGLLRAYRFAQAGGLHAGHIAHNEIGSHPQMEEPEVPRSWPAWPW